MFKIFSFFFLSLFFVNWFCINILLMALDIFFSSEISPFFDVNKNITSLNSSMSRKKCILTNIYNFPLSIEHILSNRKPGFKKIFKQSNRKEVKKKSVLISWLVVTPDEMGYLTQQLYIRKLFEILKTPQNKQIFWDLFSTFSHKSKRYYNFFQVIINFWKKYYSSLRRRHLYLWLEWPILQKVRMEIIAEFFLEGEEFAFS